MVQILAVLLVLVPLCVRGVTVEELQEQMKEMQEQMKQKDLQHEQEQVQMNGIISALRVIILKLFHVSSGTISKID